jgi:hypothetical protein
MEREDGAWGEDPAVAWAGAAGAGRTCSSKARRRVVAYRSGRVASVFRYLEAVLKSEQKKRKLA